MPWNGLGGIPVEESLTARLRTMSSVPSPAARATLFVAVAITAAAVASVLLILGVYFAGGSPHPALFWAALWGLPAGFVLMCGYVGLDLRRRRRLRTRTS